MVACEFYWLDPIEGYQHIGTLPERRKNPTRITQIKTLVQDILTLIGADDSRPCYSKIIRILGETTSRFVYLTLSYAKDAHHRGEIKTTRDQYSISTIKRLCQLMGVLKLMCTGS